MMLIPSFALPTRPQTTDEVGDALTTQRRNLVTILLENGFRPATAGSPGTTMASEGFRTPVSHPRVRVAPPEAEADQCRNRGVD